MLYTKNLDEWTILLILLTAGLFVSACNAQTNPVVPTRTSVPELPEPASTPTVGPFTVRGEFILTNTSTPGMEVGVETMAIILEYQLSPDEPWQTVAVNCSFDPSAPVVFQEDLVVQYECQYLKQPPPDAERPTTAEVKIFGNDEVFRLEVNSP